MDDAAGLSELFPGLRVRFTKPDSGRMLVYADAESRDIDACPKCGGHPVYKHGSREFEYADTQLGGVPSVLRIDRRRFRCGACKAVITPELALIDDKRDATKRLVTYVEERCFTAAFNQLAKDTGLAVNTVRAITQDHISRLQSDVIFRTPRILGLAGFTLGGAPAGAFINLEMRTLFDIQNSADIYRYLTILEDRSRIERAVIQASCGPAIIEEVEKVVRTAKVQRDPFDYGTESNFAYSETVHSLLKAAAYIGQGYSFEIARARLLYGKIPRQAGTSVIVDDNAIPDRIEYGAHIPTLLEFAERGEFD